ncbi:DUF6223 family protein [Nocardia crassostreae]|uniref:DUF6223 family protein n=1 Tax=Nocardia crassostreae TaxID=53428 RepID=UPI00082FE1A7|nr:DUF6223 family protein [Nocardia crassostreae]
MSARTLPAAVTAALLGTIALAAPAAASVEQTAAVTGMTSGRLGPTLTALVGLFAVVVGGRALLRSGRPGGIGRGGAVVAVAAGLISAVVGAVFAATADGGPGTGNGIVGSFIAVVLGLVAVVLGGLTLNRSRRVTHAR